MPTYDAIVLGTGGVGGAALWHLARRGVKVLGVDRFDAPHDRGSSHGQSRILRQAYFEHPNYTPLLVEAYRLWSDLAAYLKRPLYSEIGVLLMGPPDGEIVTGVLQSAARHGVEVEQLSPSEIQRRWSALHVPVELSGVYEPQAGVLFVEECVAAHLEAARCAGAELQSPVEVHAWQPGPPVTLQTSAGTLTAERLIVTAGAWTAPLLAELQLDLQVRRKSVFWYPPQRGDKSAYHRLPCFLYELPEGVFYGVPQLDDRGVKIAEHSGGQPTVDPLEVHREIDPSDAKRAEHFIRRHVPGLSPNWSDHTTCLYTMTPDQHFIVDAHPNHPHVVFAAGLSGHGFKFAPVLGQALAELALDGNTDLPIGFLGLR